MKKEIIRLVISFMKKEIAKEEVKGERPVRFYGVCHITNEACNKIMFCGSHILQEDKEMVISDVRNKSIELDMYCNGSYWIKRDRSITDLDTAKSWYGNRLLITEKVLEDYEKRV